MSEWEPGDDVLTVAGGQLVTARVLQRRTRFLRRGYLVSYWVRDEFGRRSRVRWRPAAKLYERRLAA